jgi:uncharacterized coiled-coil protein SlyX
LAKSEINKDEGSVGTEPLRSKQALILEAAIARQQVTVEMLKAQSHVCTDAERELHRMQQRLKWMTDAPSKRASSSAEVQPSACALQLKAG